MPAEDALFAYGTLALPEVMEAVTGVRRSGRRATLPGHARCGVRGQVYPAAVQRPGATTSGVLYEGLPAADWALLDRFEGDLYERLLREVVPESGERRTAWVYLLRRGQEDALSPEAWSLDAFAARHLQRYVAMCRAFRASQGRSGARGNGDP